MGSEEVQVFCYGADHLHYIGGKVKKKPRLVVHSEDEQLKIIKLRQSMKLLIWEEIRYCLNLIDILLTRDVQASMCIRKFSYHCKSDIVPYLSPGMGSAIL